MTMSGQDSPPSSKTAEKFVVRLPRGMRRRIADAARCYRRSMNSEIVARLEQSLDAAEPFVPAGLNEPAPDPVPDPAPTPPPDDADRDEETRLLRAFRTLSAERRRALLALLD